MDAATFLEKILPRQGFYILAVFYPDKKFPTHYSLDSTDALAKAASFYDHKHLNVYHACASYVSKEGVWNPKKERHQLRVAANVGFIRAQWLDIDVGEGKDYATRNEAAKALLDACKALKIPAPMIVGSGKVGLHCYWTFTRDVSAAEAKPKMLAFAQTLKDFGFKCDPTRTADLASILRPIGSHNRKGDPVEVVLLRDAPSIDPDQFYVGFKASLPPPKDDGEDWGIGSTTYAPSSAKGIVRKCAVVADFAFGKPVSEPLWFGLLGLLKRTTEGDKVCHHWSKADPRYDAHETQEKINNAVGPTTCETFSRHSDKCAACPHFGKITTPLQLGYTEDAPPPIVGAGAVVNETTKTTSSIQQVANYANLIPGPSVVPFWPKGYSWDGVALRAYVKDKDGNGDWIPFSNTLYYPFLRYETEDRTRAIMVCALTDPKKGTWRVFEMDTAKMADARTLASALAEHEIVYMPHSKENNMRFVQDVLHGIRAHSLETTTYNTFGWHENGFVIGDIMLTKNKPAPIFLGSRVPRDLQGDFGTAGTASEWARMVNHIYNRLGAEPAQFVIACAFASVLVKLCESDMWHGIPVGVTGEGGEGKSTMCKVACSAFGSPRKSMIQANDEGTTINALIQRIATMRNLPMLLDEITGRDTNELQAILFALSNGEPKRRLKPDGTEVNQGQSWDAIAFITGNMSITRMLADSDRVKADASQVRCFEIHLEKGFSQRVFGNVNGKDEIEHQLLNKNYGVVGREFITYVLRNREQITKVLQKQRAKIAGTHTGSDSKERFYYDLIATAMVAIGICHSLRFVDFDVKRLRRWALDHVVEMRSLRTKTLSTAEDYMQGFLAYLYQHTVTTKYYRDARTSIKGESVVAPLREPLARHATEDRRFIVTMTALHQWCATQTCSPDWLISELSKEGYLMDEPVGGVRQRICRGTYLTGTQARCIEFVYDKLDESKIVLPDYISPVTGISQQTSAP